MTAESKKWLKFRIVSILIFFLILFIALIARAFQIQVISRDDLKSLAKKQHIKTLWIEPERGVVFDRNGEKLAVSVLVDSVCADPSKIEKPKEAARKMASIIKVDKDTLVKKLSVEKNFCWIARKISPDQAMALDSLNIEGVFLTKEPKRFYPNGPIAGRLLGFVGLDSAGLEGLELKYDSYLRGDPEKRIWARDAKGKRLYPRVEKSETSKKESYHLILTIDSRIQHLVESKLNEAIAAKGAKGAFAVVMDPRTGEILALADQPGFDPNKFSSYGIGKGKNKVITDIFDPGSTFKPFLAAAALEEGIAKETDRFYCENGAYAVADRVIREANRKKYGHMTFHDILKYSSNIGCVKISERLGKEKFYEYITKFGFGSKTGIDLPGEVSGILRPYQNWTRVDTSTIAFGQGISVTAIQLVTALSAIANGGVLMKPYIVRAVVDKKGEVIEKFSPTPVRRVIEQSTAKRLAKIMTDVVGGEDGTGKRAQIKRVSVAGKTGTSQKFDFSRRAYSSEKVRTSFMGFFPADDPQVVMLVTLDEPQIDRWGGLAAAPVFKDIGEQILSRFKTNIRENPPSVFEEEKNGINTKLTLVSSPALIKRDESEDAELKEPKVPDFTGMSVRDVLKLGREKGIEIKIVGSGWASSQDPKPGVSTLANRSCTVNFSIGH